MRFKTTEIISMFAAGIACVGAVVSAAVPALYTHTSRNRELDIKLVEIGIGILRSQPTDLRSRGAREWAIRVIESHSGQVFSATARKELIDAVLVYSPTTFGVFTGGVLSVGDVALPCSLEKPCRIHPTPLEPFGDFGHREDGSFGACTATTPCVSSPKPNSN